MNDAGWMFERRYSASGLVCFSRNRRRAGGVDMTFVNYDLLLQRGDKVIKLDNQIDLNTTIASLQEAIVQFWRAESFVE